MLLAARRTLSGARVDIQIEGGVHPWTDLYHLLLTTTWARLVGLLAAAYLVGNALFGCLYLLQPGSIRGARTGSFADAFFFSIEAMSTVGFGSWTPATTWAHVVVSAEVFVGLLGFAMATGLVFARVSRPTARVVFSSVAVVQRYAGEDVLAVRMCNARRNLIVEAELHASILVDQLTEEGVNMRRILDLDLVRNHNPVFALSWTAMHRIVPGSPLYGRSPEELDRAVVGIIFALTGVDESFSQPIHARTALVPSDIRWGHVFQDLVHTDERGRLHLNVGAIDMTRPQEPAPPAPPAAP